MTLWRVGSPEARAAMALAEGQRIVRMEPSDNPLVATVMIVQALMDNAWTDPSSLPVKFITSTRARGKQLAARVLPELAMLRGEQHFTKPGGVVVYPEDRVKPGVGCDSGNSGLWLKETGQPPAKDLLVIGLDPAPWRQIRTAPTWAEALIALRQGQLERSPIFGKQILLVGPEQDWFQHVPRLLVVRNCPTSSSVHVRRLKQPWGSPPLELVLAGSN